MTSRRKDLTPGEVQQLRGYAAEGRNKTSAAKALGIPISRLNDWADRTGFRIEMDALFPAQRAKLVMTDDLYCRFAAQARQGAGIRQACTNLGTTPASAKVAAHEAGCLEAFCALFPAVRKTTIEVEEVEIPRESDPAVKWLTREWRRAA